MPGERLSMRTIRELLRLRWEQKLSQPITANSLRLSQASVSYCITGRVVRGLTWPLPDGWTTPVSRRCYSRRRRISV